MHAFECMRKNFISSGLVIHLPSYYSTGDLRFRLPEPIPAYDGTLDATAFGPACPQQKINLPIPDGLTADAMNLIVNSIFQVVFPDDEDCECRPLIKFHKSYSGNRSDYQCRHACERHTGFQIACCRGMSPVPPRNFGSSISTLYSGYLEVGKVCLAIRLSLTRPKVVSKSVILVSEYMVSLSLFIQHEINALHRRYDGGLIVDRSIQLGEPVIYVSMNYRYAIYLLSS